jgi:hypothetical protein
VGKFVFYCDRKLFLLTHVSCQNAKSVLERTVTDVDMDAVFKCINSIDRCSFLSNRSSFELNTHSLFLYRLSRQYCADVCKEVEFSCVERCLNVSRTSFT